MRRESGSCWNMKLFICDILKDELYVYGEWKLVSAHTKHKNHIAILRMLEYIKWKMSGILYCL